MLFQQTVVSARMSVQRTVGSAKIVVSANMSFQRICAYRHWMTWIDFGTNDQVLLFWTPWSRPKVSDFSFFWAIFSLSQNQFLNLSVPKCSDVYRIPNWFCNDAWPGKSHILVANRLQNSNIWDKSQNMVTCKCRQMTVFHSKSFCKFIASEFMTAPLVWGQPTQTN